VSELYAKVKEDIVTAMKAKESEVTTALRSLDAAIKNKAIDAGEKVPTDAHVLDAVGMLVKRGMDSVEQFTKGGREDLAKVEQFQVDLFRKYLPKQLSAEELAEKVKEAIAEAGVTALADIGKVMKILSPRVKGLADGKEVNRVVRELLS
jgi:uncharacterized protein YqeY